MGEAWLLTANRSADVAPEEHVTCIPPQSVNKAVHSVFETQKRYHYKSKTGVSLVR